VYNVRMGHTPVTRARFLAKMLERRRTWIAKNGPCRRCGSWERPEVDHKDPATKVAHNIWSWSEARREQELSKCQVLCYECHKEKTKSEIGSETHGSGMYHKGCRCDICREYDTNRKRAWRARTGKH
jgi:hypothetical protein